MSSLRPLKVFLCHAHPDADKVRALYARLKADGVDAWLDKENIIPGQDWEMEIRKAVRESDIVVVCLSKQFSQKGYRQNEVRIALDEANQQPEGEIFIIPARLEECNYLESLKRFHGVDLFEERGYEYLMRALRLRADKIGAVLQAKKGWLGGLTSPTKKPDTQKPKPVVKPQPMPKPEEPKPVVAKRTPRKWNTRMIAAIAGVVVVFAAMFGLPWNQWFTTAPDIATVTPTNTVTSIPPQPTLTKVSSTATFTPVLPMATKTPTPTPTLGVGSTQVSEKDGMVILYIPEGEFVMGSNPQQLLNYCNEVSSVVAAQGCWIAGNNDRIDAYGGSHSGVGTSSVFDLTDEIPSKNVFLDAFWMDKTEITNSMYALCVEAGVCDKPTHEEYFDNSDFTNFPVINVSWYDAKTYCEWVKRRLPTEAEWEKTARSADGRLFPWGNNQKNCSTYDGDVLSCPELSSPYGVLNMMNFAREWTADWYMKNYYAQTISINPSGPETGELKVIRGNYHWRGYVANREKYIPSYSDEYTGFRCARDANP